MNKKLLNLVVTLVAMFLGITAVNAENGSVILTPAQNITTWETAEATFTISGTPGWNSGNKMYSLAANSTYTITWAAKSGYRLTGVSATVKAQMKSAYKKGQGATMNIGGKDRKIIVAGNNLIDNFETTLESLPHDSNISIKTGISQESVKDGKNYVSCVYSYFLGEITINYTYDVEVKLSAKAGKYGTFIAPFIVTLPEGVNAYSATVNDDKTYVNVTELVKGGEELAANTPVILKNETDADVSKSYYGSKATAVSQTSGVLIGYYKAGESVSKGYYALQTQNGVQKFYPIKSDTYKSTANKCYLMVPLNSESGASLRISFDENATSVEEIATSIDAKEYYSVSGAKLSAPKKGVNLVKMSDGSVKKVFVK